MASGRQDYWLAALVSQASYDVDVEAGPTAQLYGWDTAASDWVKLVCNAAGKLIIDPSEIFEDPPTDGETGKAATSNWSYDHKANASAHHVKYTNVEARAAIGNLLDSAGAMLKDFDCNYKSLINLHEILMKCNAVSTRYLSFINPQDDSDLCIVCHKTTGGSDPVGIELYNGTAFERVAVEPVVDSKILTHKGDASAHHTRYADSEARAAIGDLLNSEGKLLKYLNCNYLSLTGVNHFIIRYSAVSNCYHYVFSILDSEALFIVCYKEGVGLVPAYIQMHNGTTYATVATEPVVDSKIATHAAIESAHHTKFTITEHDTADRHPLANLDPLVCSEAEADSKIDTHAAIAAAHHTRYTDAEAVAAVGYGGTKYWSCPGTHFTGMTPAEDSITYSINGYVTCNTNIPRLIASVSLPQGAVVTSVIVRGNAGAEDTLWVMARSLLSNPAGDMMAGANINTADTVIDHATIDNSLYGYYLYTGSFVANDALWGAVIIYTI